MPSHKMSSTKENMKYFRADIKISDILKKKKKLKFN